MILPRPECEGGYTAEQVRSIMGDLHDEFQRWMSGQTVMLCEGRRYNHETRAYEPSCGPHGVVTYRWGVGRFLLGLPVID